jgi:Zn-dependent protease
MFGMAETPYDLRFRLLDIPVRVHPMFWLTAAFLGWQPYHLTEVLIFIACMFVSVLVHEYGHGLMAKALHASPSILLWGMGGLCFSEAGRQTPRQRLAVVLWGPGAGFVLLLAIMAATTLVFGITPAEHLSLVAYKLGIYQNGEDLFSLGHKLRSNYAVSAYDDLVFINLMWGLLNLLPILPLDGGRVSEIAFRHFNRGDGTRRAHILSLLVAGIFAVISYGRDPSNLYTPVFFGILALINLQSVQAIQQTHAMGLRQDDDWWRG